MSKIRKNGAWVDKSLVKKRVNGAWVDADKDYYVRTPNISGVPPFTFKSDGENLRDWSMSGQTVQASTPTPSSPVAVEGVGEKTGNLFDRTGETVGYYLESDGNLKKFSSNEWSVSDYIRVSGSTQYTFEPNSASGGAAYHVYYDSSKTFISSIASGAGTFTTPNNAAYMRFSYRSSSSDIMLNTGSTALPYEPYGWCIPVTCGGTTTNIYLDSATSTRRVKKLVLTGTENITAVEGNAPFRVPISDLQIPPNTSLSLMTWVCSHYQAVPNTASWASYDYIISWSTYDTGANRALRFRDVRYSSYTAFKQYLADQYAAGTPVIVWYVLTASETITTNEPLMKIGDYADELTKTSTGVNIPTVSGSNTLTVNTTVQPSGMTIQSISQWV